MKRQCVFMMLAVIFVLAGGSASAVEYTHIWIDQGTGINHADTNGTPEDPFKSITYALARADFLEWPEPWCVHIGPGVYDADPAKPGSEREIFPIELRQDMIFEGGDVNDPNTDLNDPDSRIIDGQHLVEGLAPILLGQNLTGLEIRGLTFRNMDHSTGNGGAIELVECAGKIENCIIENNSALSGGGLWLSPRTAPAPPPFHFIACSFIENTAINNSNSHGGGVYVTAALTGDISGCSFTGNSAYYGGGGFSVFGTLNGDIIGSSFVSNSTNPYGGGFYVSGTLNGDIIGSSFVSNSANSYGGGFYVSGTLNGDIRGCEFVENSSGSAGMAFYLSNPFGKRIENCIFTGHEGVAVYLTNNSDTLARIRSCLFVAPADPDVLENISGWAIRTKQKTIMSNNTIVGPGLGTPAVLYLPSAVYIEFNTEAENGEIFNNIIVDTQCAIHVDAAVDMPITYNQFYNINEIVCQGEQGLGNDIWWLEYNLSNFRYNDYGDPLFFASDSMYHIQETSPCVDVGDPSYVAEPDETDIDGQPRVAGYGVDRGADEYFTYILTADIYYDGIVNFLDFAVLARYWQQDEPLADIAPPGGDGIVDFLDLGILVDEWLLTEPWY